MTIMAKTRFQGASEEGIALIDTWILESRHLTADLLRSATARRNETLSYIVASSDGAFGKQWAHFHELRAISVLRSRERVVYWGANLAIFAMILSVIAWLAPSSLGARAGDMIRYVAGLGMAALVAGGGMAWGAMLRRYLKSRSLGYADLFTRDNGLTLKAWGVCDAATYVVEVEETSRSCRVRRISASDIAGYKQDVTPLGTKLTLIEKNGRRHDLYEPCRNDQGEDQRWLASSSVRHCP